jgi:hypothetical protein
MIAVLYSLNISKIYCLNLYELNQRLEVLYTFITDPFTI